MKTYDDLVDLVRGPKKDNLLPAIWDYAPCHFGAVGTFPDMVRYYFDTDLKLDYQLKLVTELFPDALILPGVFPDLGVVVEVSAFGGQLLWFDNGAPYMHPPVKDLSEIDSLKKPEPGKAGLTPVYLTQRRIMADKMAQRGLTMEKFMMSMGPAEVAGLLIGYEKFYLGMFDDPVRLKMLMELVTDFIIDWLKMQDRAEGGAKVMVIADHVPNQVAPDQLSEFIIPYEKAICEQFPGAIKIYHNEGRHSPVHMKKILEFGADMWHFGSDYHSMEEIYANVGDAIVPFGGVDPHGVMRTGTPDEVRAETRIAVDAAKGHRLLLSTGTGTTPEVNLENQRAMVEEALA